MNKLIFETRPIEIDHHLILHFPKEISAFFPSRGMVVVEGTLKHIPFKAALEPDGMGSHWFELDTKLIEDGGILAGDLIALELTVTDQWYEPDVPKDLMDALNKAKLNLCWDNLTVRARWEWVRWVRFTKNPDTRKKRIEVTCSKLESGKKRPCCFDLSRCTVTDVSKNGKLNIYDI